MSICLRLRDIEEEDLALVGKWLDAAHVRGAWGDPGEVLRLLEKPPAAGHWRAIIEADGKKVGLVLWQHPTREELALAGLADIPETVIDIDIMVGEAGAVGLGIGSSAIRLVAEAALSDPNVPFVIACASLGNIASQRAFAKAGFCREREFDDFPEGRYVLMVRRRHADPRLPKGGRWPNPAPGDL